jgi:hypothetical protein
MKVGLHDERHSRGHYPFPRAWDDGGHYPFPRAWDDGEMWIPYDAFDCKSGRL